MKTGDSLVKLYPKNQHIKFGYWRNGYVISRYIANPINVNCMTNVYMPYMCLMDGLIEFTTMYLNRMIK